MRTNGLRTAILAVALVWSGCAVAAAGPASFTLDQMIDIKWPSSPAWSPNSQYMVFVWNDGGTYNLWLADTHAKVPPRQLTYYRLASDDGASNETILSGGFWSRDSRSFYYPYHGQLWAVSPVGGSPHPAWTGRGHESAFSMSPDGTRVAFARTNAGLHDEGVDLIVRNLAAGSEAQVAHDPDSIFGILWSPDGKRLAYSGGSRSITHDVTPPYVGRKLTFVTTERTDATLYVVAAAGGPIVVVGPRGIRDARWLGTDRLVFSSQSDDFKTRTIYVAPIDGAAPKPIHKDVEPKFWSLNFIGGASPQPSPTGEWISFLSDVSGWDQLYIIRPSGKDLVRVTNGEFSAWRPTWSHDGTRIAFDANAAGRPGDRQIGVATIGRTSSGIPVRYITEGNGTNIEPVWSPDDKQIIFQHTDPQNSADLFTTGVKRDSRPVRLTESMPTGVDRSAFVTPELVYYPSADGKKVPAWLFVPRNIDKSKKHAAIVWAHGDGINANYDGWHVQRHYSIYYALNQYLVQHGYIVLAPDYRGSIGYGRDWRTDVHNSVGVDDETDIAKSVDYLETLPYVDTRRVGIYGLSYGGFFTLQTMTEYPELFSAGIDIAGVADFSMYYDDPYHSTWIASRLGGSPLQNPKGYEAAAPVNKADKIDRPLLILAGTADVNVPFLQSLRMVDQTLKSGKGDLLSLMIYPGEFHYFDRRYVLRDAWTRVVNFFDSHLRPNAAAAADPHPGR